jgi:mono/diheme cytochrome c family protein
VKVLKGSHQSFCKLSEDDWQRLYTWLDANAVYHDYFIYKRGPLAETYNIAEDAQLWAAVSAVHARRCASCHGDTLLARPEWVHLNDPEESLFLSAPLRGAATPSGRKCDPPPYADRSDPDYQTVLQLLREALEKTWRHPRRDLRCLAR